MVYLYSPEFNLASHILVATVTILFFDTLLTISAEVEHIWVQPWTFGTALYLYNRYSPFIDSLMALHVQMTPTSVETCQTMYAVVTWCIACGLMVSELIILLRTWAIWHRKRWVLLLLGGMSSLTFGPGIALTYLEIKSFEFEPAPPGGVGCRLVKASKLIMIAFCLILLSETVVVALTAIRGYQYFRSSNAGWVKRIYRDGFLFYVYLLVITIINMIAPLVAAEPLYKNWLAIPQRVFHSILCNRVILMISRQRTYHSQGRINSGDKQTNNGTITNMLDTDLLTSIAPETGVLQDEFEYGHELASEPRHPQDHPQERHSEAEWRRKQDEEDDWKG